MNKQLDKAKTDKRETDSKAGKEYNSKAKKEDGKYNVEIDGDKDATTRLDRIKRDEEVAGALVMEADRKETKDLMAELSVVLATLIEAGGRSGSTKSDSMYARAKEATAATLLAMETKARATILRHMERIG